MVMNIIIMQIYGLLVVYFINYARSISIGKSVSDLRDSILNIKQARIPA